MEFYIKHNDKFVPLAEIKDVDLEIDEKKDNVTLKHILSCEPMEMSFTGVVEDEKGRNVVRLIASGSNRGLYNGLTLREEGHLGVDNAWL